MKKYFSGVIASVVLLLLSGNMSAQTQSSGQEIKKADVNLTELAEYYRLHPLPLVRKMPFDEEEEEGNRGRRPVANPAKIHLYHAPAAGTGGLDYKTTSIPGSPAPNDTFQSTISPGTAIPPDTHGAVDSQYCVTAINTNIHIQTRNGANLLNVDLDAFWSSVLPTGTGTFDPRVHYDPYHKRWIMVTDAVSNSTMTGSTILIAISVTNNPTGSWHMYAVPVDPTGASWMDFPNVGYNQKWVAVTGNMFPNTGSGVSGAVVYVFNYANMLAGTGAPYTKFSRSSSFAICPALTYDVTEPNLFALESTNGGSGQLELWKISGSVGSPTLTSIAFPSTTRHWQGGASSGGNFLPQVGTAYTMEPGDDRITNVIYRNHKLWCSHTAFLPATGTTTRSSIMWWQIDTLGNPVQNGLIDDPTGAVYYAYSSIAVNTNNDALVGFGYFSHSVHPSGGYALHMNTDPVDSMRSSYVFRHGIASYYETFGGTRNRWGDYSGTCIDPRNDSDFWTIQESTMAAVAPNWDTWWANVQICPKPYEPSIASAPSVLCIGNTGTWHVNPIAGATSYAWIVTGTGWSGSSTVDSIDLTAGTAPGIITVFAYNSCGQGASHTFTITPGVPPVRPVINTTTAACIGAATAVYHASTATATSYFWQAIGTGWSGTSATSTFTANVGTGTGSVICTAINSCGSSPADTMSVTPAVVPVSSYSVAMHTTYVNVNDTITFTGSAPTGSTYTWYFGGGPASPGFGAGPNSVYWPVPGLKTINLTVSNAGCSSFFSDTVLVLASTEVSSQVTTKTKINIIPNPSNGSFDIVLSNPVNKALTVKISDMQGRIVYDNEFSVINNNRLPVQTQNFVPGTYTLTIYADGLLATEKITIRR